MDANEAKKTIADITCDIIANRGGMDTSRIRQWGAAYAHWKAACEPLTLAEIDEAIAEGRTQFAEADAELYAQGFDDGEI